MAHTGSPTAARPQRPVITATLLLVSAALQFVAAAERWLIAPATWTRSDRWIEDHLFDYSYPFDPWENVGAAAQWFGVGYLLLALGVLALTDRGPASRFDLTKVAAVASATCLGLTGVHALASGVLGGPTFLQGPLSLFGVVGFVALLVLAATYARSAPGTALACGLLLITTTPGYLFASMIVAPAVVGEQSYDTTPHTETVVAVGTAAAAVVLLVAVIGSALARRKHGSSHLTQREISAQPSV